jgi:hypothetical protein
MLPPSRFNPDVSKRMDEVVVRALAADPADRYPDVKTFLAALGASTVVPAKKPEQVASGDSCPQCGAENQTGRFCRKCGARLVEPRKTGRSPLPVQESALEEAVLDEPIQVTKVDVGRVHIGKGVEASETVIARPTAVAGPDLDVEFPEPLDMPHLEVHKWAATEQGPAIEMPEPPPIPDVDWAEIAPAMPKVPKIEDDPPSEASD